MLRAAFAVAAVALGLAVTTAPARPTGAAPAKAAAEVSRCRPYTVPAWIGGRLRCLAGGQRCERRYERGYHRYLFHCHGRYLVDAWDLLRRRPLRAPTIESGAPCPTSAASRDLSRVTTHPAIRGPAWGRGPAYPWGLGTGSRPRLEFVHPPLAGSLYEMSGWGGTKVLWLVAARYYGPVLVRGRQLDGSNEVRFENGRPGFTDAKRLNPDRELRLYGPETRANPASTRLRAPGCYAYQVDGRGFSYLIVFEAFARSAE